MGAVQAGERNHTLDTITLPDGSQPIFAHGNGPTGKQMHQQMISHLRESGWPYDTATTWRRLSDQTCTTSLSSLRHFQNSDQDSELVEEKIPRELFRVLKIVFFCQNFIQI